MIVNQPNTKKIPVENNKAKRFLSRKERIIPNAAKITTSEKIIIRPM